MNTVDLGRFSKQVALIEHANLQQERASKKLSPEHPHRHPVHVVYGGAHMFKTDTVPKIQRLAHESFTSLVSDGASLRDLLDETWSDDFAQTIYQRVEQKLKTHAIEDYRIDFEDGYGTRSDQEEDQHARESAQALVQAIRDKKTSPLIGIRIKPFSTPCLRRSLRTLITFAKEYDAAGGRTTGHRHLIVTLPKVANREQVGALVEILESLERDLSFSSGFFLIELLVETPEALLDADGRIPLPHFIEAARGRCVSLHFGVFDFTASLGIGSAGQAIDHVACDFARMWMQIAGGLAPGLGISDGIVNVLPLAKHKAAAGTTLNATQIQENQTELTRVWRYNYEMMMRSLRNGFYQGWDLHPAQVPIRHVAHHAYVLQELPSALKRMLGFLERSAQANSVGSLFDDRASVLGLINFAERGLSSGILTEKDFHQAGVSLDQLRKMI